MADCQDSCYTYVNLSFVSDHKIIHLICVKTSETLITIETTDAINDYVPPPRLRTFQLRRTQRHT